MRDKKGRAAILSPQLFGVEVSPLFSVRGPPHLLICRVISLAAGGRRREESNLPRY